MSNSIDFRDTRSEVFLFDTGVGVSIIGETIAKANKIKVYKSKTPRQIVEASGNELDIKCLVLRGNYLDREILVSCETLKMGHCTPHIWSGNCHQFY